MARSADLPQVGAGLDLTRQLFSNNFIYPPPLGGSIVNSGTLQLSGSWELDFFGKNRAALDAAIGSANAAIADAEAARILLTTRVASTYIQWARLEGLQAVATRTLAQREETLQAGARPRLRRPGHPPRTAPERSRPARSAPAHGSSWREQIALTKHALDALVGAPGATEKLEPPALDGFKPIALLASIPADLLGHRADVAAARWRVEAATKDVANAKTLFYPNIDLVAIAGYQSLGFDKLLKPGSLLWSFGPAIRLPIFEGGQLRANLRGKNADLDAAIESYNGTVLDAVRDVADQVVVSAVRRAPAGAAARRPRGRRRRVRHRRAALQRGPGHLPERAHGRKQRAGAATRRRRPRGARTRHPSRPCPRAGRRLPGAGNRRPRFAEATRIRDTERHTP